MIADWSWLGEAPPQDRSARLRDAWYADETGLWDWAATVPEGAWRWPRGADADRFCVYEFRRTAGSFKAHFWAGQRWDTVRGHADPLLRAQLDALLGGLVWTGADGEAEHTDPAFLGAEPPAPYGVLLARTPDGVRELAALWRRIGPRLGGLRAAFTEHAAEPDSWVGEFGEFADLLDDWGRVLTEADRRGWCVVGLSE